MIHFFHRNVCHLSQRHGHSHYPGADHYSASHPEVEEGEKEKLQQNGEASSRALVKLDAGEGELMLSPAQTPEVGGFQCQRAQCSYDRAA